MSMAPSVESSSFSQYSSNPIPPVSSQPGVGTGGWFKEHALIILLGVIALVAVLWFIARRGSSNAGSLSPDTGYPLGYPSVGAGTSGGSGASSGGSGSSDTTGTGATQNADALFAAFLKGYDERTSQIPAAGATDTTSVGALAPGGTANDISSIGAQAPSRVGTDITSVGAQAPRNAAPPSTLIGHQGPITAAPVISTQALITAQHQVNTTVRTIQGATSAISSQVQSVSNVPKAGSAIASVIAGLPSKPGAGTHVATTSTPKPVSKKTPPKKPSTYQKGTAGPRAV